jgi:hypothetical protein
MATGRGTQGHRQPDARDGSWRAPHPAVELVVREVSFAQQVEWLLDGTVDAAVLCPGPPFPEFERIAIADETYLERGEGLPDRWVDINHKLGLDAARSQNRVLDSGAAVT